LLQKKGIKRQADTTTPGFQFIEGPPVRRESTRQVKKPRMDLPGEYSISSATGVRYSGHLLEKWHYNVSTLFCFHIEMAHFFLAKKAKAI